MRDPFPNTTSFPASVDQLPNCVDAGSVDASLLGSAHTTMWASHFNRLADFINKVEPILALGSASTDGTISRVSYSIGFEINMSQLLLVESYSAYTAGVTTPTNVYPYEFTITTNSEGYTPLVSVGKNYVPLTFITNQTTLDTMFNGFPIMDTNPMVTVTIGRTTGLSQYGTSRWITNAYALLGNNTIVIRGILIDTTTPAIGSSGYPSAGTNFDGGLDYTLYFSIMGVM